MPALDPRLRPLLWLSLTWSMTFQIACRGGFDMVIDRTGGDAAPVAADVDENRHGDTGDRDVADHGDDGGAMDGASAGDAPRDGGNTDGGGAGGDNGDSVGGDAFLVPVTVTITAPTSSSSLSVLEPAAELSGSCSTNATGLTSSIGTFLDDDCTDGTWALDAVDLVPGVHIFTVEAQSDAGATAADELQITFDLVRIEVPTHRDSFSQNGPPARVAGFCSTTVTATLTANIGSLTDADCSDGDFSLEHTLALGTTTVTIMANGGGAHQQDSIDMTYDAEAPIERKPLSSDPASGANDNFPLITTEPGRVVLYSDSACQLDIGSNGRAMITDNTTTALYAKEVDAAGNAGPCSSTAIEYVESSPFPPACDTTITTDMSFAAFQAVLDQLQVERALHDADGVIAVCVDDGVRIETNDASEGGPISMPGGGFQIFSPNGTGYFTNNRSGWNDGAVFRQEGSGRDNLGWANLNVTTAEGSGPGFHFFSQPDTRVAYIRNVTIDSASSSIVVGACSWIAEISGCQLSVKPPSSSAVVSMFNCSRIGLIRDSTITKTSADGVAIGLNSTSSITQMTNVTVHTAAGVFGLGNDGSHDGASHIASIIGSRFRKTGNQTEAMIATTTYADGAPRSQPWFVTGRVSNNVFCTASGAEPWSAMLSQDGQAYTDPTVEWTPSTDPAGSRGIQTFPWGDAATVGNPGFNTQAQWGGVCP